MELNATSVVLPGALKGFNSKKIKFEAIAIKSGQKFVNSLFFKLVIPGGGVRERCTSDQFQCGENGKCIPLRWQCDFHRDCDEGQDEYDCRKFLYSLPTYSHTQYKLPLMIVINRAILPCQSSFRSI